MSRRPPEVSRNSRKKPDPVYTADSDEEDEVVRKPSKGKRPEPKSKKYISSDSSDTEGEEPEKLDYESESPNGPEETMQISEVQELPYRHDRQLRRVGICCCGDELLVPLPVLREVPKASGPPGLRIDVEEDDERLTSMGMVWSCSESATYMSPQELDKMNYVDEKGNSQVPWMTARLTPGAVSNDAHRALLPEMKKIIGKTEMPKATGAPKRGKGDVVLNTAARFVRLWCRQGHEKRHEVFTIGGTNLLPILDGVVGLFPLCLDNCLSPDYPWITHRMADLVPLADVDRLLVKIDVKALKDYICDLDVCKEGELEPKTRERHRSSQAPVGRPIWNEGEKIAVITDGAENTFRWDEFPGLDRPEIYMRDDGGIDEVGERPGDPPANFQMDPVGLKRLEFSTYRGWMWAQHDQYGLPAPDTVASLDSAQEDELISANAIYKRTEWVGLEKLFTDTLDEMDQRSYFIDGTDGAGVDGHQSWAVSAYEDCGLVVTSLNHFANLMGPHRSVGGRGFQLGWTYYSNGNGVRIPVFVGSGTDLLCVVLSRVGGIAERLAIRHLVAEMLNRERVLGSPFRMFGEDRDHLRIRQLFDTICSPENARSINRWVVDFAVYKLIAYLKVKYGGKLRYGIQKDEEPLCGRSGGVTFADDYRKSYNRVPNEPRRAGIPLVGSSDFQERRGGTSMNEKIELILLPNFYHFTPSHGDGTLEGLVWRTRVKDPRPAAMRAEDAMNLIGTATAAGVNDVETVRPCVPRWELQQLRPPSDSQESDNGTGCPWRDNTVIVGGAQAETLAQLLGVPYCGYEELSYSELLLWSDTPELKLLDREEQPALWVLEAVGCSNVYPNERDIRHPLGATDEDVDISTVGQSTLLPAIAANIADRGHHFVHVNLPRKVSGIRTEVYHRCDLQSHHLQEKTTEIANAYGMLTVDLAKVAAENAEVRDWEADPITLEEVFDVGRVGRTDVECELTRVLRVTVANQRGSDGRRYRAEQLTPLIGNERANRPLVLNELIETRIDRDGYKAETVGDWNLLEAAGSAKNSTVKASVEFLRRIHKAHRFRRGIQVLVKGGERDEKMSAAKRWQLHPKLYEKCREGLETIKRAHRHITARTKPSTGNFGHKLLKTKGTAGQLGVDTIMAPVANPYSEYSIPEPQSPRKKRTSKTKAGQKRKGTDDVDELSEEEPKVPTGPPEDKGSGKAPSRQMPKRTRTDGETPTSHGKTTTRQHSISSETRRQSRDGQSPVGSHVSDRGRSPSDDRRKRPQSTASGASSHSHGVAKPVYRSTPAKPWNEKRGLVQDERDNWEELSCLVDKEEAEVDVKDASKLDNVMAITIRDAWLSHYPDILVPDKAAYNELFLRSAMARRQHLGIYGDDSDRLERLRAKGDPHEMFYGCTDNSLGKKKPSPKKAAQSRKPMRLEAEKDRSRLEREAQELTGGREIVVPIARCQADSAAGSSRGKKKPWHRGKILESVGMLKGYEPPPLDPPKANIRFAGRLAMLIENVGRDAPDFVPRARGIAYSWVVNQAWARKERWSGDFDAIDLLLTDVEATLVEDLDRDKRVMMM